MNTIQKYVGAIALIVAIIACFLPVAKQNIKAGAITDTSFFDYFDATTGFKLSGTTFYSSAGLQPSTASTAIVGENFGVCSIQSSATTIAATTTATLDCQAGTVGTQTALAGITAGDKVFLTQSTTTSIVYQGVDILGASASSTPGFITMKLFNGTGATFTWTAAASSSFQYLVTR